MISLTREGMDEKRMTKHPALDAQNKQNVCQQLNIPQSKISFSADIFSQSDVNAPHAALNRGKNVIISRKCNRRKK